MARKLPSFTVIYEAAKRRKNAAHGVSRGSATREGEPQQGQTIEPEFLQDFVSVGPCGAGRFLHAHPRLAPWAAFLRRFAAGKNSQSLLHN